MIERWKRVDEAAKDYHCAPSELERWAASGLIYGYHVRGAKGGWLIQSGQFEPSDIRIRERKQAA